MKKSRSLALVVTLALSQMASVAQAQTMPPDGLKTLTLHSPKQYKVKNTSPVPVGKTRPDEKWTYDITRAYFDFNIGKFAPFRGYDLSYGTLSDGHDDWFVVGIGDDERTVIKDLGQLEWSEKFKAPIISPLPALKPGEHRYFTTQARGQSQGLPSGIRGAPSARDQFVDVPLNGLPDVREANVGAGRIPERLHFPPLPQYKPSQVGTNNFEMSMTIGPNLKGSRPAPLLARVVPGHLYLIHVVKAQSDFYVLIHVDGLVPGDNCTISWKRIPPP
jgi:hypothetical protein